jgi:hypothetical protein
MIEIFAGLLLAVFGVGLMVYGILRRAFPKTFK